jgi:hypothetical protein
LVSLASASAVGAKEPAEPRPFRSDVVAVWDNVFFGLVAPPAHFAGISKTTHLGKAAQNGTLFLAPPNPDGTFPGHGSVTITGANGDTLTFNYAGTLNAATGEGTGTFNFTGGTGRFDGATGSGTFEALINTALPDNQPMTVKLAGRICY